MIAQVYWIEGPWSGRLGIVARPRGGDWLEDEVQAWRKAGIDVVVSALTEDEIDSFELEDEERLCVANGIKFVAFAIADRQVPTSLKGGIDVLHDLESELSKGHSVAVHCRQSIGRSSLIAAGLLVSAGIEVKVAFDRIQLARGCPVPETAEQRAWVERLARELSTKRS
ncbi:MAG TPA: hypothetical protein VGZ25_09630 [Gemmataceae bacterium]|jgi:protein-tyrosine phosphatase|nr:hypothetical protein [Gemmataceae bacterium]